MVATKFKIFRLNDNLNENVNVNYYQFFINKVNRVAGFGQRKILLLSTETSLFVNYTKK